MLADHEPNRERLGARNIVVAFGGVKAVDGVDFAVAKGEIVGLIGPNGAGKTTLLNVLSGYLKPTEGRVLWSDKDITALRPHQRARLGLARTFQGVRLFGHLTVLENAEVSALGVGASSGEARRRARLVLEVLGLQDRQGVDAAALAYGEQRRLGLARAASTLPKFALLDEPAAGLSEVESVQLTASIMALRDRLGCAMVVVDHDMRFIMQLCERIEVLDHGRKIFAGTPTEVLSNPTVREAYLGTSRVQLSREHPRDA